MSDESIVVVQVVAGEMEADMACGLLRTEGIRCGHRQTTSGGALAESVGGFGAREIFVDRTDADRARELLEPLNEAPAPE